MQKKIGAGKTSLELASSSWNYLNDEIAHGRGSNAWFNIGPFALAFVNLALLLDFSTTILTDPLSAKRSNVTPKKGWLSNREISKNTKFCPSAPLRHKILWPMSIH